MSFHNYCSEYLPLKWKSQTVGGKSLEHTIFACSWRFVKFIFVLSLISYCLAIFVEVWVLTFGRRMYLVCSTKPNKTDFLPIKFFSTNEREHQANFQYSLSPTLECHNTLYTHAPHAYICRREQSTVVWLLRNILWTCLFKC